MEKIPKHHTIDDISGHRLTSQNTHRIVSKEGKENITEKNIQGQQVPQPSTWNRKTEGKNNASTMLQVPTVRAQRGLLLDEYQMRKVRRWPTRHRLHQIKRTKCNARRQIPPATGAISIRQIWDAKRLYNNNEAWTRTFLHKNEVKTRRGSAWADFYKMFTQLWEYFWTS